MIKSRTKPATKPKKTSKKTKDIIEPYPDDDNLPVIPDIKPPPILSAKELKKDKRLLFQTVEEMEVKINSYFQDISNQPYHIAGLKLHVGIFDDSTYKLYSRSHEGHYQQFNQILKAAEHIIESGLVDQLFTARRYGAVIFYLKSKLGYTDTIEHIHSHQGEVNISFTAETSDEKTKRIAHARANEPQAIDITPQSVKDQA